MLLKEFFAFIWADFKSDVRFLKDLVSGKVKADIDLSSLGKADYIKMLEDSWIWYLIIALAFFCGFYYASQYYQDQCNQILLDRLEPVVNYTIDAFYNMTLINITG